MTGLGLGGTAKAAADGKWRIELPAMPAGGPYRLTVSGKKSISLENVLIGDVWLCAGQSNMQWTLAQSTDEQKATVSGARSDIRLLQIRREVAAAESNEISAAWTSWTPETTAHFSAVACYFGVELGEQLKVPVGLIDCSWGGTPIEPWMPTNVPPGEAALRQARTTGRPTERGMIYNGMIAPLTSMPIRGVIWYQGENNVRRASTYGPLLSTMITGWRKAWNQDELPVGIVQIPPYDYSKLPDWHGTPQSLPRLREGQAQVAKDLSNVGMVITTDLGATSDIHPPKKREVGLRLVRWAMVASYGAKDIECWGPTFKSASIEGSAIRIHFDHVSGGLVSKDGKPLSWFQIAAEDRKFVPAQATIDGDSVIVQSDAVNHPAAVRFAFVDIAEPNLFNRAGLPAAPFRTDDWPLEGTGTP